MSVITLVKGDATKHIHNKFLEQLLNEGWEIKNKIETKVELEIKEIEEIISEEPISKKGKGK